MTHFWRKKSVQDLGPKKEKYKRKNRKKQVARNSS
jgi:hypothetical protein